MVSRACTSPSPHSHLCLKHEGLSQRLLQNCPAVIQGVQEAKQLATQLPILNRHRATQQPKSVVVARVELLETVQDEEVRPCRPQSLRAQTCLRKIKGKKKRNFKFLIETTKSAIIATGTCGANEPTSNNVFGSPTMSNRRRQRVISVLRAHPTTTSRATSKWSKNSMTEGRMLLSRSSAFVVVTSSSAVASNSTTVWRRISRA